MVVDLVRSDLARCVCVCVRMFVCVCWFIYVCTDLLYVIVYGGMCVSKNVCVICI
jgi:hypothetical protein